MSNTEILLMTILFLAVLVALLVYDYKAYKKRMAKLMPEPIVKREFKQLAKTETDNSVTTQDWIDTRPPNSGSRFL